MPALAPVNKIIPFSLVDGPGSRTSVFLQGCNISCAYCHNPETQRACVACGTCVAQCPAGALSLEGGRVVWDEQKCIGCDTCIGVCRHYASPKVKRMSAREVFDVVAGYMPFIRGVSVSGGECMLHPGWLYELFSLCRDAGLGTLIDSNGTVAFDDQKELLSVTDGVMLDVKAWDSDVFRALTRGNNDVVKRNLTYLSAAHKIEELRIVVVPGRNDPEATIDGIAEALGDATGSTKLKLIKFRCFGVKGELANLPSPDDGTMRTLEQRARAAGFAQVELR